MVGNNFLSNIDTTICTPMWSVDFLFVLICVYLVGEGRLDRDTDVAISPGLSQWTNAHSQSGMLHHQS